MQPVSQQAELVTGDDRYWPEGFADELVAAFKADSDGESEFKFAKHEEKCSRAAVEITADLIADPRGALGEKAGQGAAFQARLEARWGRGLDLADVAVWEAHAAGSWVLDLLRPAAVARQDQKFGVLIRLHGKAVLTAREALTLLRSGHSSGAFARWRTLHEVRVVMLVLADGEEDLIRRYLAHEAVEALKGQKEYESAWEILEHEPPDWTCAEREQERQELKDEFGSAIFRDYGWAAPLFDGKKVPTFRDLEQFVELDPMRSYYRLSSQGVHANARGITWNIQELADVDIIMAGPSNVGLEDPAQCLLLSVAAATGILLAYATNELSGTMAERFFNQSLALVRQRVICLLVDHATDEFVAVGAQMEAEDEELAGLVGRAATVLREGTPMTAEGLSAELDVDLDDLEDALDTAVARGELLHETLYRIEADNSATGEQASTES